ncbi:hypothetical protein STEG23_002520, partial [Scotinomys teguina]
IVRETPISGVRTFYTDANKQGKAGYKSEDLSKVVQSPYNSVQKSELYAILLVLMDFSEPLNIVTDSQYAERVVLHIETAEFIPDESELTSLFIQLQDIIRNRKHPLYITHIRSHTGLPGPLAQGNDEIDKLLIGNVLEASEFHKKHHVNSKGLKRDFSITWQQAKEIVRKCPTCSFYNQTPLPAGCNPKGTQRNDIWQMDVFHFAEFGKLKYVHHTIDTYSGFQWATALSSEKADSVITHLLEVMAIMGIPAQIKTDNAPAYVSGKMKQFFAYYNIKHITDFKDIEQLKEAVLAYGTHTPFTLAIFESFTALHCTPCDWQQLCQAALFGGDYLLWRSEFQELCQQIANQNAAAGFPSRNLDMLTVAVQYANLAAQIRYDPVVYTEISAAAMRAWKALPNKASGEQLSKVIQGPSEPFSGFVDRLFQLAGKIFGNADQVMPIVKQLTFENG